jgi:hypothetical protein
MAYNFMDSLLGTQKADATRRANEAQDRVLAGNETMRTTIGDSIPEIDNAITQYQNQLQNTISDTAVQDLQNKIQGLVVRKNKLQQNLSLQGVTDPTGKLQQVDSNRFVDQDYLNTLRDQASDSQARAFRSGQQMLAQNRMAGGVADPSETLATQEMLQRQTQGQLANAIKQERENAFTKATQDQQTRLGLAGQMAQSERAEEADAQNLVMQQWTAKRQELMDELSWSKEKADSEINKLMNTIQLYSMENQMDNNEMLMLQQIASQTPPGILEQLGRFGLEMGGQLLVSYLTGNPVPAINAVAGIAGQVMQGQSAPNLPTQQQQQQAPTFDPRLVGDTSAPGTDSDYQNRFARWASAQARSGNVNTGYGRTNPDLTSVGNTRDIGRMDDLSYDDTIFTNS